MSFEAYIDNIKAKTGKSPDDFKALAVEKGLGGSGVKAGQIIAWLKEDFGLGHGHAMAIYSILSAEHEPRLEADEKIDKQFAGGKARWRKVYDDLLAKVTAFGPGVSISPTDTYISLLRDGKKFGIVAVSSAKLDIGIKCKGAEPTERFALAGSWNAMVTHRVSITDPAELDAEVIDWLRQAYDNA